MARDTRPSRSVCPSKVLGLHGVAFRHSQNLSRRPGQWRCNGARLVVGVGSGCISGSSDALAAEASCSIRAESS